VLPQRERKVNDRKLQQTLQAKGKRARKGTSLYSLKMKKKKIYIEVGHRTDNFLWAIFTASSYERDASTTSLTCKRHNKSRTESEAIIS
jgi:hypothetical protein